MDITLDIMPYLEYISKREPSINTDDINNDSIENETIDYINQSLFTM